MTTYKEQELRMMFKEQDEVEITIVDEEGKISEEKFTTFEEAKHRIEILENENEVFF